MTRRFYLHLLCALTIFAVQSFAVVHATRHELSADSTAHCDLCAVAHAAPMPPSPLAIPPHTRFDSIPVELIAPGTTDRRPFARPNTRAPPHPLV
jgi:rubredoxin